MSKGVWQKIWTARSCLCRVFFAGVIAVLIALIAAPGKWLSEDGREFRFFSGLGFLAEIAAILASAIFLAALVFWKRRLLWRVLRWMFNWRMFRRCLYGLSCLIALTVLFYAEEDWRGRHDWERFKRTWEAKGERFDFASFVPPAVPDDQNFALTPLVANSCILPLDRMGNEMEAPNTNGAPHLDVEIFAPYDWKPWPTNDFQGNWQRGMKADLRVFQTYYRAPFFTNPTGELFRRRRALARRAPLPRDLPTEYSDATNAFPVAPEPQSPAADVLLALSKYDAEIAELRQASRLPYSRFPTDYEVSPPGRIRLPYLEPLIGCAAYLRLRAIAELESGQTENALDDVRLNLYLANAVRGEPLLVLDSRRIAMMNFALQPIWEGLVDKRWSDAQLAALEAALGKLDCLSYYQAAVRAECALVIKVLADTERNRSFRLYCSEAVSSAAMDNLELWRAFFDLGEVYFAPKGWFYENEITLAEMSLGALRTEAEVDKRILNRDVAIRGATALTVKAADPSPYNFLAGVYCPDFSGTVERFAFAQSCLDRARVACALERYRLAHGEFPETLDALPPQFIAQLPHDIINGQPLHYRREEAGHFLLYSVGWNGTDDGGMIVRKGDPSRDVIDMEKGDWVWPDSAK